MFLLTFILLVISPHSVVVYQFGCVYVASILVFILHRFPAKRLLHKMLQSQRRILVPQPLRLTKPQVFQQHGTSVD